MKKETFQKYLPYGVAFIVFLLIAAIYCSPLFEGKVIFQEDMISAKSLSNEGRTYREKTGEGTFWTNSLFSGMPNYQIGGGDVLPSSKLSQPVKKLYTLFLPDVIARILGYLIGFFILLRAFKVNKWVSIVGAIAITFSSYFFIIIGAGHMLKVYAIGCLAPIVASFFLICRRQYVWGISLALIFSMMGIIAHPQMTFYIFMLIGVMAVAELFNHIKEKSVKDFVIGVVLFVASVGVGLGTGYGFMQVNREYVKETMRGGHSELAKNKEAEKATDGLDLDYATQWSYGIDETMTLLIPNFKGGSSHYDVGVKSNFYNELRDHGVSPRDAENVVKHTPTYWGEQPFTAGGVYVGAIVCFLFVLGLIIVRGPYKWALLAATLFSIALAWGRHFMWLTEFFMNWFPMYNKFRAVSSILVVAEIAIPLLGFLAIKAIMDKSVSKEKIIKSIYISAGITAGICLIFALFGGSLLSFTWSNDDLVITSFFNQIGLPDSMKEAATGAILADRVSLLRSDAFRSFVFIMLGAGLLWLYVKEKVKFPYFIAILGVFILVDMWGVNKRFLNDDNFISEKKYKSYFKKTDYEELILQDQDPHFRVYNLTTNSFNDARTSYYLKSIGGYSAAKLRRYQDLIEEHISKGNLQVISMLNTKYIIVPGQEGTPMVQRNPDAMGNAWFIDSVRVVKTPDEEMEALGKVKVVNTAVLDAKFESFVKNFIPRQDSVSTITLTKYAPNRLEYMANAAQDGIVVFSEIYYPYGWHAYIDGKPVEHFRVNYTLRALNVPAGEHVIKFEFSPDTLIKGDRISVLFVIIVYITVIGLIVYEVMRRRKKTKQQS